MSYYVGWLFLFVLHGCALLFAMLFGWVQVVEWGRDHGAAAFFAGLIAACGLFWLAGTIHTLGQLLGGLACGMAFGGICAGPFALARGERHAPLRLSWGGWRWATAIDLLPRDARKLRTHWAIMLLSGPIIGVAVTVGSLLLAQRLHARPAHLGPAGGGEFAAFVATSTPELLLNLLAASSLFCVSLSLNVLAWIGGAHSTGTQLLALATEWREAEAPIAAQALARWTVHGVRPREWDAELVSLLDPPGDCEDVSVLLMAAYRAFDCGEMGAAEDFLDRAATSSMGYAAAHLKQSVQVEPAFVKAFHRGSAEEGRFWLELVPKGAVEEHTRLRAEAAVLFAEGRFAAAAKAANVGLALVPLSRDLGGSKAERDWLEAVAREAQRELAREQGSFMPAPDPSIKKRP
jgi:hypothetical protein